MTIQKTIEGNALTVTLDGRLDTNSAPQLENELKGSLTGDVKILTFDFGGIAYISSAGLRVILSAQKVMNKQGEMVVKNVSDSVMEVFEMTGFTDILTFE